MKLKDVLKEASYPGNIGMMEMFKFYSIATDEQKAKLKEFMESHQLKKAWDFMQLIVGIKLR